MNITVTITDDEKRILDSWLGENKIVEWLQHALSNKIRQRMDASLEEVSKLNPKRLTREEKLVELAKHVLPTRDERDRSGRL